MSGILTLTEHPLQRCGAWSVSVLASYVSAWSEPGSAPDIETPRPDAAAPDPSKVTPDQLNQVSERIADDAARAAVARPNEAEYDWWKILFALYPNSPPTHAQRKRDHRTLRAEMVKLLGPDPAEGELRPCVFCGVPSSVLWSKSLLPLFDTNRVLNTLPPGVAGWPVCRACRVAMWALPYGAWLTAGSATVLTCNSPRIEREFARVNVLRAIRIQHAGFRSLSAGAGPEAVVVAALREHADAHMRYGHGESNDTADGAAISATLWIFKNDNQDPWLRVYGTRVGVTKFLRRISADPDARAGWKRLRRAMERRSSPDSERVDGETAVARLLFQSEGENSDPLLRELHSRLLDPEVLPQRAIDQLCALSRIYLEVMHDMDVAELSPVADIFVRWISQESTRGRFNEFRQAITSPGWELPRLYVNASARLFLDGNLPAGLRNGIDVDRIRLPFEKNDWRGRVALYTVVLSELIKAKVEVGKTEDDLEDDVDDVFAPDMESVEEYG